MSKPEPYQTPVLDQIEWALRMFKTSAVPESVDVPELIRRVDAELRLVTAQRNDLLAALRAVEVYLSSSPYATDSDEELREVRAAIAKAERL